jgi:hypothetical protein
VNAPATAWYFYRLREDDFVAEFCVAGASDPTQYVETLAPDGTCQRWARREEGDLLVFRPPDGYSGAQGLIWAYNRRLQRGQAMPYAELERRALGMRVSVHF